MSPCKPQGVWMPPDPQVMLVYYTQTPKLYACLVYPQTLRVYAYIAHALNPKMSFRSQKKWPMTARHFC